LGVVIYVWTMVLYRRRAQEGQPQAREVMARDTRKPVLYLRPFKVDANHFRIGFGKSRDDVRAEPSLLEPFKILVR
jgi:hypothetical protein